MTASALRKLLSELFREHDLEYLIKRHEGNLMTVRFYVEGDKQ
jgi:hypothetical protein